MMNLLFWLYLVNAIFLIIHEIDSAYWKEWELFKIPGGLNSFLLLHFPIIFIVLYGLVEIKSMSSLGLLASLLLGISGLTAFFLHHYFIKKGHSQFKTVISQMILTGILIVSILQLGMTVYYIAQHR